MESTFNKNVASGKIRFLSSSFTPLPRVSVRRPFERNLDQLLDDIFFDFRKFGTFCNYSLTVKQPYRIQDMDPLMAEDFFIIEYDKPLLANSIVIHKNGNCQGAVVRVWGAFKYELISNVLCLLPSGKHWTLLWSGPALEDFEHRARTIPLNNPGFLINVLKVELSSKFISYYPKLSPIQLDTTILPEHSTEFPNDEDKKVEYQYLDVETYAESMPEEVMIEIFKNLDMASLRKCTRVNKRWNVIASNPILYRNLDLSRFWHLINPNSLMLISKNYHHIKKLDLSNLSYCNITYSSQHNSMDSALQRLIYTCRNSLTHLCLNNNFFVTNDVVTTIAECPNLLELRLQNTLNWTTLSIDKEIKYHSLETLDLSTTRICANDLVNVLKKNSNLLNLLIESNLNLRGTLDLILDTVTKYNTQLKCWCSWKTFIQERTPETFYKFGHLTNLEELELGRSPPCEIKSSIFSTLAEHCPKLRRLVLCGWIKLGADSIQAMHGFKELILLDLKFCFILKLDWLKKLIIALPKLQFLDITNCVKDEEVQITNVVTNRMENIPMTQQLQQQLSIVERHGDREEPLEVVKKAGGQFA
ncbi:hypothetical protein ABEB36_006877 [Hypothenemus hampei]|uniref:F-box domain-containing protein n=1 Tax=Hypothenemus hampei TaxID=57062 RepID=A0ABD1ES34_HYPHA